MYRPIASLGIKVALRFCDATGVHLISGQVFLGKHAAGGRRKEGMPVLDKAILKWIGRLIGWHYGWWCFE